MYMRYLHKTVVFVPRSNERVPAKRDLSFLPHRQQLLGAPLPRFPAEACGVDIHSMRLSLMKGAHADLSSAAWQEIGVKPGFGLSGIPQHSTRPWLGNQELTQRECD